MADPTATGADRPAESPHAHESALRAVIRSAGARFVVLGVSTVIGIITTRLIISRFGPEVYAEYGLLITIAAFLPFADLGLGAALMNVVAGSPDARHDDRVRRIMLSCLRILMCSSALLTLLAIALFFVGAYPAIFGGGLSQEHGSIAAMLCLILVAIALPFGIGQRILVGLSRNHTAIIFSGLQAPLMLLGVFIVLRLAPSGGGSFLPVINYAIMVAVTVLVAWYAARLVRPVARGLIRDAFRPRSHPGLTVSDLAWPMLIQMIVVPLAMQTDRIIISQVSTVGELAKYNLTAQLLGPIYTVTSAAGMALWPIYARSRQLNQKASGSPIRMAAIFGIVASGLSAIVVLLRDWLSNIASDGLIHLGSGLVIGFAVMIVCQAVKYPLGMYLTDVPGMRFQALMVLIMLPINVGISILLARDLGAIGPVIGSIVGFGLFQVVANWLYIVWRRRAAVDQEVQFHEEGSGALVRSGDDDTEVLQ